MFFITLWLRNETDAEKALAVIEAEIPQWEYSVTQAVTEYASGGFTLSLRAKKKNPDTLQGANGGDLAMLGKAVTRFSGRTLEFRFVPQG
jgi:hypothetical protein